MARGEAHVVGLTVLRPVAFRRGGRRPTAGAVAAPRKERSAARAPAHEGLTPMSTPGSARGVQRGSPGEGEVVASAAASAQGSRAGAGMGLEAEVPSPTCPSELEPQARRVPSPRRATEWFLPAATAVIPEAPECRTGMGR